MNRFLASGLLIAVTAMVGCGSSGPTDVAGSADSAAIAEYERLLAEQNAATDAAPPNEGAKPSKK